MKYFVMSDIHGDYEAMMKGLEESNYDENNSEHQLIVIGDYFGRATTGTGAYGIFKYLTSDSHKNKPICLRGNHEDILRRMFDRCWLTETDICNGEDKTLMNLFHFLSDEEKDYSKVKPNNEVENLRKSFSRFDDYPSFYEEMYLLKESKLGKEFYDWIISLPFYCETDNYIFTHGWLPYRTLKDIEDVKNLDFGKYHNKLEAYYFMPKVQGIEYTHREEQDEGRWIRRTWCKTPDEWVIHCSYFPNGYDKWIVVGHWHAFNWKVVEDENGQKHVELDDDSYLFNEMRPEDVDYVIDDEHKVIFCDQCTVFSHHIHVLELEDTVKDEI